MKLSKIISEHMENMWYGSKRLVSSFATKFNRCIGYMVTWLIHSQLSENS